MQAVGLAAGFFGVLIIIAKGDLASLAAFRFNSGDLLLIAGLITWSLYTAFLRKRPHISWQSFNISTYAVAAVANIPLALFEHGLGHSMKANAATIATIAYVAIFPSLLAYIFYNRGVELLGPARTGLYMFLVPVFGSLLAVIFLGERLHLYHALGFAFIIGGVVIGEQAARGQGCRGGGVVILSAGRTQSSPEGRPQSSSHRSESGSRIFAHPQDRAGRTGSAFRSAHRSGG